MWSVHFVRLAMLLSSIGVVTQSLRVKEADRSPTHRADLPDTSGEIQHWKGPWHLAKSIAKIVAPKVVTDGGLDFHQVRQVEEAEGDESTFDHDQWGEAEGQCISDAMGIPDPEEARTVLYSKDNTWCPRATCASNPGTDCPTIEAPVGNGAHSNVRPLISQALADACKCARNRMDLAAVGLSFDQCGQLASSMGNLVNNWNQLSQATTLSSIDYLKNNEMDLASTEYLEQLSLFFDQIHDNDENDSAVLAWCAMEGSFLTLHEGEDCISFEEAYCQWSMPDSGNATFGDTSQFRLEEKVCNEVGEKVSDLYFGQTSCIYMCGMCRVAGDLALPGGESAPFKTCVDGHISGDSIACVAISNAITPETYANIPQPVKDSTATILNTARDVPVVSQLTRSLGNSQGGRATRTAVRDNARRVQGIGR